MNSTTTAEDEREEMPIFAIKEEPLLEDTVFLYKNSYFVSFHDKNDHKSLIQTNEYKGTIEEAKLLLNRIKVESEQDDNADVRQRGIKINDLKVDKNKQEIEQSKDEDEKIPRGVEEMQTEGIECMNINNAEVYKKIIYNGKNLLTNISILQEVHDDVSTKPYSCTLCTKTFAYKMGLKKHMDTHAGNTFHCRICSKTFSSSNGYYSHKSKKHRTENRHEKKQILKDVEGEIRKEMVVEKHKNTKNSIVRDMGDILECIDPSVKHRNKSTEEMDEKRRMIVQSNSMTLKRLI